MSLLIAWQIKDKRVLVVGGGDVASGRIRSLLLAEALVTVIAPGDGLHPETRSFVENSNLVTYYDRLFNGPDDLDNMDMVLTAIDDVEKSREICDMCRERKIPVNVADIPPSCDFYFGSMIHKGPLQIMVSTNGCGPKLASLIRQHIESGLPENVEGAIVNVGLLRTQLRERTPEVGGKVGKERMRWMSTLCTKWNYDQLSKLDMHAITRLLDEGWEKRRVPSPREVGIPQKMSFVSLEKALPVAVGFMAGVATAFMMFRHRYS